MSQRMEEPSAYVVSGDGVFVSYDANRRLLRFRGEAPTPVGDTEQVDITATAPLVNSPIGRLATAEVVVFPDAGSVAATLVVPDVNLGGVIGLGAGGDGDEVAIDTVLLFTTYLSSIGGPGLVHGQLNFNRIVTVQGVARRSLSAPCGDWHAFHNHEPPGPFSLIVTGECTFPSTGYSVELRRHVPPGINPRDLLLDLVVTEPTGVVAPVITTVPVRYEEETDEVFDTVTILPDGPSIPVTIAT